MNLQKTQDLYTPTDIKRVRELLLKEQQGQCKALGIVIPSDRTPVLDHAHDDEQFVRGVLERECNAFIGQIENAYKRFLGYWLSLPLPVVLNRVAAYLDASVKVQDRRYRHTGWIKKLQTSFNTLTSKDKSLVISMLGSGKICTNDKQRKDEFKKILMNRELGFLKIKEVLVSVKSKSKNS